MAVSGNNYVGKAEVQTYIRIADDENEEPIEVPTEDDSTILLSTITGLLSCAACIHFVNPS